MREKYSKILDSNGNNIVKTSQVSNLDPGFWTSTASDKTTVRDVLQKPFENHVWVFACIRAITRNVSQVRHLFTDKKTEQAIDSHAVLSLLEKPNSLMTHKVFIQTIVSYLLINPDRGSGGQCFIIPWNTVTDDKVRLDKGEIPSELFPYPCNYFSPAFDKTSAKSGMRQMTGWIFEIPGHSNTKTFFANNEIIRVYIVNPYDLLQGMSAYTPIKNSVEVDALADLYNQSNFMNDGRLDGVFTTNNDLDQVALDDVKETYYKECTGPNRRRVAFFTGGMKYEQFAISAMEMGYLEQQKWSRSKILGAYGLNRIAIGDYEDINFATIREGRKILWYDTYIPMDEIIVDALNYQWIHNIENNKYKLTSFIDHIPALSSDMKEKATVAGDLVTKVGLPASLAMRIANITLKEDDIAKYPFLDEQPKKIETQAAEIKSEKVEIVKADDNSYSDHYVKSVLSSAEKIFRAELDKYFYRQRNIILNNIDKYVKNKSFIKEFDVKTWELIPDDAKETEILRDIYTGSIKVQVALERKHIESELDRIITWDASGTKVAYWTSIRSGYLKQINTKTFSVARDAIESVTLLSLEEGLTVTELQKKIKTAVEEVYEVRLGKTVVAHGDFDLGGMSSSKTIARTEMGTIASMTRNDIFKQEKIEKIKWVTASDEKVRSSHAAQNNKVILFGDRFGNGLKFPRDPDGAAAEVINCRCSFSAVFE
jgi:phage portal protein BeeE